MKPKFVGQLLLALALITALTAALSGCARTAGEPTASAPETVVTASDATPSGVDAPSSGDSGGPGASVAAPKESGPAFVDDAVPAESTGGEPSAQSPSGTTLDVRFGDDGAPFTLHLYDNDTAAKIAEYVGTADWRLPIYHYDDYDNWEVMQYYDIPSRYEIPSSPERVASERAGTVYYSEPNRIVLFYQDAEVPGEYTPVGYIDGSQELVEAVENNPAVEGWGNKIVNISR